MPRVTPPPAWQQLKLLTWWNRWLKPNHLAPNQKRENFSGKVVVHPIGNSRDAG
jgi:hypothetical protein